MSNRMKALALAGSLAMLAGTAAPAAAQTELTLWTQEGQAQNAFEYVESLAAAYSEANPDVSINVINKDTEALREDLFTASMGGAAPDILWTVSDHVGPFTAAGLIAPLDDVIDAAAYVPAALDVVTVDGQVWGAPTSFGNHLMLYYNKDVIPEAPANTDELVELAVANTDAANGQYGLVYDQAESFWLVPWLGGFGGSVFAEDGVTPTLDTEAMVGALTFLHDLKYEYGVMPADADYNTADGLFKEGLAPMIINGDWTLGAYVDTFGDALGLAPIPQVVDGDFPKPYVAGKYLMMPSAVTEDEEKAAIVADFINWATNTENQLEQVELLARVPGNAEAIADPLVTEDPFIAGSAAAAQYGTQQPTNLEMRCIFDAMTNGIRTLYASADADPAGIAATMQSSVDNDVAPGGACGPE